MTDARQKAVTDLALADADRAREQCTETLSVADMWRRNRAHERATRAVDAVAAKRKSRDDRAYALGALQAIRAAIAGWLKREETDAMRQLANAVLLISRSVDAREVQPLDGLRKAERAYYAVAPRLSTAHCGQRELKKGWCYFKHRIGDDLDRMYDEDTQCKGCPDRAPCREAASK